MTLATTLLATALVVPSMPPPEYDDCEVITNCVFDASRGDAKMFAVQIELDATSSNGVEIVFGRDADGDGRLSRTEAEMAVGYCCGEWKVTNIVTGDTFSCAGTFGCTALDWKLRLNRNRTPRSLAATVNGQPTFTQLATPPPFLGDDHRFNLRVREVARLEAADTRSGDAADGCGAIVVLACGCS